MANVYTPKHFLRQSENALLEQFFSGTRALAGINWKGIDEKDVEPIYKAWLEMPEETNKEVEQDFRDIFRIATAQGIQTLIVEARFHNREIADELELRKGFLNKALWVFLNDPRVFNVACQLNWADQHSGRNMRKRKNIPKKEPKVSREALERFEKSLSQYFRQEQGRGRLCHVDTYLRGGRFHYFFAYPQDHTDTFIGYGDDGNFKRRPQTPAFEVIFIYDPIEGTLELFAVGDKKLREALQTRFVGDILDDELGEEDPDKTTYDLSQLTDRHFGFPTDAADHVKITRVREMQFSIKGQYGQTISLSVSPDGPKEEIYDLIDQIFKPPHMPLSNLNLSSVGIQMQFDKYGPRRRSKKLSFKVSHPDSCNLKDSPEELIAKKYLRIWGIERA